MALTPFRTRPTQIGPRFGSRLVIRLRQFDAALHRFDRAGIVADLFRISGLAQHHIYFLFALRHEKEQL